MDENQLKLLWRLHAEKNGGFKDYDEFKSLMANDKARKAYFDTSNSDLGFKDYNEFQNVLSGGDKPQANNSNGGEKAMQSLYAAVSAKFDVGDYKTFSSKMQSADQRKNFYEAVGGKGFDLGDYNSYESRLSGEKKSPSDSGSSKDTTSSPSQAGAFDPNQFMQQSRSAVLSDKAAQDNQLSRLYSGNYRLWNTRMAGEDIEKTI